MTAVFVMATTKIWTVPEIVSVTLSKMNVAAWVDLQEMKKIFVMVVLTPMLSIMTLMQLMMTVPVNMIVKPILL
jgi:hypothetical protein